MLGVVIPCGAHRILGQGAAAARPRWRRLASRSALTLAALGVDAIVPLGAEPDMELAARVVSPEFDTDGDGRISRSECMEAFGDVEDVEELLNVDPAAWLEEMFVQADVDSDGYLDADEAMVWKRQVHEAVMLAGCDSIAGEMMDMLDANRDRGIDVEEIRVAIAKEADPEERSALQHLLDDFSDLDTDGDGRLSKKEAEAFAVKLLPAA